MSSTKIIAIVLIVAGVLGLAYGKFSYTKETHDAKVGPIEMSVKDKETVNIPVWAGVGAIVIGAGLLLAGGRRRFDPDGRSRLVVRGHPPLVNCVTLRFSDERSAHRT